MHGSHDRTELRKLHLPYTDQLVIDLLLLCFQLFVVRQILPFAPAADAEVFAHGGLAYSTLADEPDNRSFAVSAFLLAYLEVYDVSRNDEWDENDLVVYVGDTFSFGCHRFYGDVLQKGEWLSLSTHNLFCISGQRYGFFSICTLLGSSQSVLCTQTIQKCKVKIAIFPKKFAALPVFWYICTKDE